MHDLLSDVTVIDASQGIAGPFAGRMLADLGAEVWSLEPPEGKTIRHYASGVNMADVERNKRSIVVDLTRDEGVELLYSLIEHADVFLHNNRPGVNERMGISFEELSEHNESLVYCSVNGYGSWGPYRDWPGIAPLASAVSGLMWKEWRLRSNECEGEIRPDRLQSEVAIGTGAFTAFGIVSAVHRARQTGEGLAIECSLLDTAAAFMGSTYTEYSKTGDVDLRARRSYAPSGGFKTKTGYLFMATPLPHLWDRLCDALDRDDWKTDERFRTEASRFEHRAELHAELDEAFQAYPRDELLQRLLAEGVTAAPVQSVEEAITDSHLRERQTLRTIRDVDGTDVVTASTPLAIGEELPALERGPSPLGQQTRAILNEIGLSAAEIATYEERGVIISQPTE